jgi:hypothetical protein
MTNQTNQTTETTLLQIDIDPASTRTVQGKILRIDLEGCDCGTCQSQPFVQISNGEVLFSVLLTDEDVESLRTNGYLTVVPDEATDALIDGAVAK